MKQIMEQQKQADLESTAMDDVEEGDELDRKLYSTPASTRRTTEDLAAHYITTPYDEVAHETTETARELHMQVTASGTRVGPEDPRPANNRNGVVKIF